ncbi:MAG: hypothetical protein A3F41_06630 [Coxiella sp. RIFCSPHIGHO2_12_FULL_44_14]|nr:MAG: hypothetical protein A3F41_06630 [Coxiella sp. RIFCSPHIGHO2_12_FULL_44_14]
MKYVFSLFWIAVILLGIAFAGLNSQKIIINYYINITTIPLPLLLFLTLTLGALLGVIVMLPIVLKSKNIHRRLKHRIKEVEQEVNNLRTLPVKDHSTW